MTATPYEPTVPSVRMEYATVMAENGGLLDLDFGGEELVTGVACYGALPELGARVMVLLQGGGATVVPAASGLVVPHWRGRLADKTMASSAAEDVLTVQTNSSFSGIFNNNGVFTFSRSGTYVVGGSFQLGGGTVTAEQRALYTFKHLTTGRLHRYSVGRAEPFCAYTFTVSVSAGDTGQFMVYQNSGGTRSFLNNYAAIYLIGNH